MIRHVFGLAVVALVAVALLYVSRFWGFRLWGSDGLFGLPMLRPQGGLLAARLQGTPLAPYELIVWLIGSLLVLTGLQKALDRLLGPPKD